MLCSVKEGFFADYEPVSLLIMQLLKGSLPALFTRGGELEGLV